MCRNTLRNLEISSATSKTQGFCLASKCTVPIDMLGSGYIYLEVRNWWSSVKLITQSVVYTVMYLPSNMALRVEIKMLHTYGPAMLTP